MHHFACYMLTLSSLLHVNIGDTCNNEVATELQHNIVRLVRLVNLLIQQINYTRVMKSIDSLELNFDD